MRNKALLFLAVLIALSIFSYVSNARGELYNRINKKIQKGQFIEGDIIFQSMDSDQCKAVKLATHSKFSHVGIITLDKGKAFVLEAVEPVCITPLKEWIERGNNAFYTVMRLKERDKYLITEKVYIAKKLGKEMVGKHYDIYFGWSDDQLYCSELVWKIYQRAFGLELCPLKKMKDFDLSSPEVKAIMEQRYGKNPPLEEQVVSPSDLAESKLLYVVEKNNLK
ncbi:MAG: YiiX family permuted papain-like enzyme [Sporocytophaga sp.]|uniref:YiiX family permuted papain-like enzyme n=1 Tax=Sporocytophaga sp. TaxID=2231183 RepID=UPI001B174669|nr:YiiX family permuted papain-like enzyme [Sporocytophaga sp.]MBO9698774.1 YiiX family permuted papain-like enzyme [Sporocytophaga sp.]